MFKNWEYKDIFHFSVTTMKLVGRKNNDKALKIGIIRQILGYLIGVIARTQSNLSLGSSSCRLIDGYTSAHSSTDSYGLHFLDKTFMLSV